VQVVSAKRKYLLQSFVSSSQCVVVLLELVLSGFKLHKTCLAETHLMMLVGEGLGLHVQCLSTSHGMAFS
jgi:hypothetical protein